MVASSGARWRNASRGIPARSNGVSSSYSSRLSLPNASRGIPARSNGVSSSYSSRLSLPRRRLARKQNELKSILARRICRGERARGQEQKDKKRHGRPHRVREKRCPLLLFRSERPFGAHRSEHKGVSPVHCIGIAIRAAIFLILSGLAVNARIATSSRSPSCVHGMAEKA